MKTSYIIENIGVRSKIVNSAIVTQIKNQFKLRGTTYNIETTQNIGISPMSSAISIVAGSI